jgi:hypothetical protein
MAYAAAAPSVGTGLLAYRGAGCNMNNEWENSGLERNATHSLQSVSGLGLPNKRLPVQNMRLKPWRQSSRPTRLLVFLSFCKMSQHIGSILLITSYRYR